MEGLDGGFECDAQETRGLWIEPLPIQIMSDRHAENRSSASSGHNMVRREHLSVGYPTKNPNYLCIFFAGENPDANIRGNGSAISRRMRPSIGIWVS